MPQFRMAAHSYATITTTTTILPPRDHNHYLFRRLTPSVARYALTTAIHRRRVRFLFAVRRVPDTTIGVNQ